MYYFILLLSFFLSFKSSATATLVIPPPLVHNLSLIELSKAKAQAGDKDVLKAIASTQRKEALIDPSPAGVPLVIWAAVDTLHKCHIIDVPDIPARAFVDVSTGLTHMIVGSTNFHKMIGNSLFNQTRECIAAWNETADPNPSHFAGDEFLDSTVALSNGTIYTLVHTEYPGNVYHNCTGKGYPYC